MDASTNPAAKLVLVSHSLCPYVQRAAILLAEQGMAFERRDIDLANKPDWFHAISPLGKTPVLLVQGEPVFESAVICEYLDETGVRRLHPRDPLQRARHRAWIEFGSALLNAVAAFYGAPDEQTLLTRASDIRARFERIEPELADGPFFSGTAFSIVDAVYGPLFRYFDIFEEIADFEFFTGTPRVRAWRAALGQRASVRGAAGPRYAPLLRVFLRARGSALSRRMSS